MPLRDTGFLPKSLIIDHVRYSYPPLWDSLRGIFDDAGAAALPIAGAVFCLLTGAGIGFGAAGLAFAGVIGAALVMQMMFETRRTAAAGVFSALMWARGGHRRHRRKRFWDSGLVCRLCPRKIRV